MRRTVNFSSQFNGLVRIIRGSSYIYIYSYTYSILSDEFGGLLPNFLAQCYSLWLYIYPLVYR